MKKLRAALLLLAFAIGLTASVGADAPGADQTPADDIFRQLVSAVTSDDYGSFVGLGTTEVKAGITKTQFDAVSKLMSPRLKAGFQITPMGELNQRGYQVYLYRLRYTDDGDDTLGTMSLKNGRVAGIYFK